MQCTENQEKEGHEYCVKGIVISVEARGLVDGVVLREQQHEAVHVRQLMNTIRTCSQTQLIQ